MKKIAEGDRAEVYEWGVENILKLYREAKNSSRMEFEYKIMRLLKGTGLPVPEVKGQVEIDGRPGIVLQYVKGHRLRTQLRASPWLLLRLARSLADLHAQIHKHIVPDLPSQRLELERSIEEAKTLPRDLQEAALAALHRLPDGNVLCHGDFHLKNVIVSSSRLIVVDWEKATQGNPMADVAKTLLFLRFGPLFPGRISGGLLQIARFLFRQIYLYQYIQLNPVSRKQIKEWQLPVGVAFLNRPPNKPPTVFTTQLLEYLVRLQHR